MTTEIYVEKAGLREIRRRAAQLGDNVELVSVLLLSIATILTAWAAFQSNTWGVNEAELNSAAAASRAEAVRLSAEADVIANIDTELFLQWLDAFMHESAGSLAAQRDSAGGYEPDSSTLSGILYGRFRDDMRVAFDGWIAERPLIEPASTKTPFERADYRIEQREQATAREAEAQEHHARAREAGDRGARYVLVAVLLAWVMLFAGMSSKLSSPRSRRTTVRLAWSMLLVGAVVLAVLPKSLS